MLGGKVVGEEYYPLGNTQFGSLTNKIKLKKPDVIFAAVVGGSNVAFYKQLKAAGITADKQTLLTLSVTEDELLGIGGENMAGFYASMKYFQSLDNPNNAEFVKAFKAKYGQDAVIGDVTQALRHLATLLVVDVPKDNTGLVGHRVEEEGSQDMQCVEPAAGLVDGLGDEVGRKL